MKLNDLLVEKSISTGIRVGDRTKVRSGPGQSLLMSLMNVEKAVKNNNSVENDDLGTIEDDCRFHAKSKRNLSSMG